VFTDIPRISGLLGRIFGLIEVRRNEIRSQPLLFAAQSPGRHLSALNSFALPSLRHTSAVVVGLTRSPGHAGAGGARSWAISNRISWNICRGTGRVAEGNFTLRPHEAGREALALSGFYLPADGRRPICHRYKRLGSRLASRPSQCTEAVFRYRNRLYFRLAHRARAALMWCRTAMHFVR
jgi:hypothetical protein